MASCYEIEWRLITVTSVVKVSVAPLFNFQHGQADRYLLISNPIEGQIQLPKEQTFYLVRKQLKISGHFISEYRLERRLISVGFSLGSEPQIWRNLGFQPGLKLPCLKKIDSFSAFCV